MSEKSDAANAVGVTNTKLAAALMALGFQFRAELVQPTRPKEKLHTQFLFWGPSVRPLFKHVSLECATLWEKGALEKTDPMHPLCVMMRANENRDRLMDWTKQGVTHGLVQAAGGQMMVYRRGPVAAFAGSALISEKDLDLVACLAGVGIPCLRIEGSAGGHVFWVPQRGYARRDAQGVLKHELALVVTERAPCAEDERRLLLEESDPLHPVVLGYDALNCRAWLKKGLTSATPLMLIEEAGTTRQALVTMNAEGRVMQRVERHLKAPGGVF